MSSDSGSGRTSKGAFWTGCILSTLVVLFMLPNRTEGAASTGTFALGWAPGAGGLRASWMMRF